MLEKRQGVLIRAGVFIRIIMVFADSNRNNSCRKLNQDGFSMYPISLIIRVIFPSKTISDFETFS